MRSIFAAVKCRKGRLYRLGDPAGGLGGNLTGAQPPFHGKGLRMWGRRATPFPIDRFDDNPISQRIHNGGEVEAHFADEPTWVGNPNPMPLAALTAMCTPVKLPGLVVTANAVGRSALRRRSPSDGEAG
ncbi:hypothetical protein [Caldilinea sp.]|uniref:hypothetical protein n=1 Tax=Caldilinea sp. TaxID=2293560 RepID=UPI0026361EB2|nr:hypothetical protein [uncultured Caldilinea sp.]